MVALYNNCNIICKVIRYPSPPKPTALDGEFRGIVKSNWEVMVPAGTYVLGDPCYCTPDEHWHSLLESCNYFIDNPIGRLPSGESILGFGTAYGDGEYKDNFGRSFPVDAGLIGLVPLDVAELDADPLYPDHVITFTRETLCKSEENGRYLSFGNTRIDTAPDEESEEGDEY